MLISKLLEAITFVTSLCGKLGTWTSSNVSRTLYVSIHYRSTAKLI